MMHDPLRGPSQRAAQITGRPGVWLNDITRLAVGAAIGIGDGLAFDPFSLQQDYLSASEVDVGRGAIIDALVVAAVGCSRQRGLGLSFHFARGSSASGATLDLALRDAVLDLVRGRGPGRIASQSLLARLRKSDFCRLDLGRARIERFGAVVAHPILSGYTIDTLESSYAPNAQ
jgi:hypothetical protein